MSRWNIGRGSAIAQVYGGRSRHPLRAIGWFRPPVVWPDPRIVQDFLYDFDLATHTVYAGLMQIISRAGLFSQRSGSAAAVTGFEHHRPQPGETLSPDLASRVRLHCRLKKLQQIRPIVYRE